MRPHRVRINRVVFRRKQCVITCAGGRLIRIPYDGVTLVRVCTDNRRQYVEFRRRSRIPHLHYHLHHALHCRATCHQ